MPIRPMVSGVYHSVDLAATQPDKLAALIKLWWDEAAKHNVLPLDDRFRERFVVKANRVHGARGCSRQDR